MFPGRPRVDAAQGLASRRGESGLPVVPPFEKLHQPLTPEGTARDEMLRQYTLGVGQSQSARGSTDDRRNVATPSLPVTPDGPSQRVRMKLKRVAFPAKRAAETRYGYSDQGNEVLKCFNFKLTLPCLVCLRGRPKTRHRPANVHALFQLLYPHPETGKTSLAKDATLFWQVW